MTAGVGCAGSQRDADVVLRRPYREAMLQDMSTPPPNAFLGRDHHGHARSD
jgi:hypothetical protein